MSDAEGRWLTYEEPGAAHRRMPNGARMFASRRNWPKRSSNRIGERATVLVPTEIGETPARAIERALTKISDVRRQLEHERTLVADATAAAGIARDEAAGLRTRLDQLQARGLWARLRNKR